MNQQTYEDIKKYFKKINSKSYRKDFAYCDYFGANEDICCRECYFSQFNKNSNCVGNRKLITNFLLKSFPNLILEEDKK